MGFVIKVRSERIVTKVNSYEKSAELLKRALEVTPLAAQTYSKSYRYFCEGAAPVFLDRGDGCYVWDVDGNKYIDFICALGPITVGYNNKKVNDAITNQLRKGISFSLSTALEVELAGKISQIIPCAEMVRFVKNGSDATFSAIKLARAFTKRDMVAACGYHGMQDWYIGSTVNNKGVPQAVSALTKTFTYNNIDSLKQLFMQYPDQIGAVILEPIQADGPLEGYLEAIKELAHDNGALLIFDEVVSGFRYALGGASEYYRVTPDLAAFGKGMANGMPISAVAGRRQIMEMIGSEGVFISTTFGGETLSIAGALATIELLEQPGVYDEFWRLGTKMIEGLQELVVKNGVEAVVHVSGLPPHAGVSFDGIGALSYLDIQSVYSKNMIKNRILTIAINNLNISHTDKEIELFLLAADSAFAEIRKAIEANSVDKVLEGGKVNPIFKR